MGCGGNALRIRRMKKDAIGTSRPQTINILRFIFSGMHEGAAAPSLFEDIAAYFAFLAAVRATTRAFGHHGPMRGIAHPSFPFAIAQRI